MKWQSVDNMPQNQLILARVEGFATGKIIHCGVTQIDGENYIDQGGKLDEWNWNITHWMQLPEAPKADQ